MKTSMSIRSIRSILAILTVAALLAGCDAKESDAPSSREAAIAAAQSGEGVHASGQKAGPPSAAARQAPQRGAASAECRVELAVSGMSCAAGCPPQVMEALESVAGVARVEIDFEAKHAAVDGGGAVCSEAGAGGLVEALRGRNFDATVEQIVPLGG